jgi:hypothetical protein
MIDESLRFGYPHQVTKKPIFRRISMRKVFAGIKNCRPSISSVVMAGMLLLWVISVHAQPMPSRMQCSPVTPETKVPFIEVEKLPNVARDPMYYTWCTDLDNAWTPQSYPDAKYVPKRTPEHEARVNLLLQGLKDYVAADSDDWVSYVNAWLGSSLPSPNVERKRFSDGERTSSISYAKDHALPKFETSSKILGVYGWEQISPQGVLIYGEREVSITGLDTTKLCITSVDLQKAFESQPGYLFRPMTVRVSQTRPNLEELGTLGGQWFGYEVRVFSDAVTAYHAGLMLIGFGFKPCAARISVKLIEKTPQGEKQ